MSTYKTNDPSVVEAYLENQRLRHALADRADAFAKEMGAKAVCVSSHSGGVYFHGLIYDPLKLQPFYLFYRLPDHFGCQHLRTSLKKGTKEQRAKLKEMQEHYNDLYKRYELSESVRRDAIFKAMGTHWGQICLSGMSYFLQDGFVYVETSAALNDQMIEIMGSEYSAAYAKYKEPTPAEEPA